MALAGPVTLDFDQVYSGHASELQSGSVLRAIFENAGEGRVLLTLENLLANSSEHIKQMTFNLDPTLDAAKVRIEQISGGRQAKSMKAMANAFKAGPVKGFDIRLQWKGKKDRFDGGSGEVLQFAISGLASLQAESFLFMNEGHQGHHYHGYGVQYAAIHVGGIGQGDRSVWMGGRVAAVPLPSSLGLLGAGLIGVYMHRKRCLTRGIIVIVDSDLVEQSSKLS